VANGVRLLGGLGNPGPEYRYTRHNVGFMALDEVADRYAISFSEYRFNCAFGLGTIEGEETVLAKPMAFMNRSGPPIHALSQFYGIFVTDILVIHDDIDLDFGRIQIKEKGGHGGHKGIRSLMEVTGDDRFVRFRIGIGRPEPAESVVDHVLSPFNPAERKALDAVLKRAGDAVAMVLSKGTTEGMSVYNRKHVNLGR
jgi:peptidyl-tRNA hydrolase, PTH1 family